MLSIAIYLYVALGFLRMIWGRDKRRIYEVMIALAWPMYAGHFLGFVQNSKVIVIGDTRDLARADGGSGQSGAGASNEPPHKSSERTSLIDDPTMTRQAGERPASPLPEDA